MLRLGSGGRIVLIAGLAGWISADDARGAVPGSINFQNVTASRINQTVAEDAANEKEVEFADYDNDGDLDVLIANALADFGQRRNKLYRNDGGTFNEVSGGAVITDFGSTDVTRSGFFRDYDNDGWLDIIVVNDNNTGGDAGRTKVFMNQHPGGVFSSFLEDGVARLGAGTGGAACSGVSIDVDSVNGPDLYVGNYPGPSQDTMYLNDGTGNFTAVTATHVPADGDYTVDVVSADMNGDGSMDLLIANDFAPNYIYYNNKLGAGSGPGDYRYAGSQHNIGTAALTENSMEPGDFDGDGDPDIYWGNRQSFGGAGSDRILQNTGNDGSANAILVELDILPRSVTEFTSRKATVADLNGDGRVDVVVMKQDSANQRPTVLRNTTVGGDISFVDWTPATAFPDGSAHRGWHAGVADTNGDNDLDILIGGWNDDHLFEQVPSNETSSITATNLALSSIYNADPVGYDFGNGVIEILARGTAPSTAPAGTSLSENNTQVAIDPQALAAGGTFVLNLPSIPADGFVSVVLTPGAAVDLVLELKQGATVIASSDRGGAGVEEALQVYGDTVPAGALTIEITESGAVPTVSEWGMLVMSMLIVTAGTILFRGRRSATA
jgi:FG-GAP-like repeat/IPTL-CTERM motif